MMANWLLALVIILALGISNVVSANFQSAYDAYRNGEYEQALTEWQALAKLGDPKSQYYLGRLYDRGEGVIRDPALAAIWYLRAAKQDFTDAQFALGLLLATDTVDFADKQQALDWLLIAAKKDHVNAQYHVGQLYRKSDDGLKDYLRAHMWTNIAKRGGHDRARLTLVILEGRMSSDEISRAWKMARTCIDTGYKSC